MLFADRPLHFKRFDCGQKEVEPMRVCAYTKHEADVKFIYSTGGKVPQERRIDFKLSREEAKDLIEGLQEFLNDKNWKT